MSTASLSYRPAALITGASRGLGRAIALQLARRGCRVAVHFSINRSAAEDTLRSLAGEGHILVQGDVSRQEDLSRLWDASIAAFGTLDILVNNAGIYGEHPPLATDLETWRRDWEKTLATNLLGPAQLCHLAANHMAHAGGPVDPHRGRGRIVNISSRGAFRGEIRAPAYGASKAGLNSLSQSLAKALAPQSIYVFCLAPGWIETDMAANDLTGPRKHEIFSDQPLGRVATVDEVARTAVFCALDAPPSMTGCIVDVNGASYLRT